MGSNIVPDEVPDDVDKSQEEWDELSYSAKHYYVKDGRREQMNKNRRKRRRKKQEVVNKIKAERGCLTCDEDEPACLDFHHTGEKDSWVSELAAGDYSIERIEREVEKCVVLCANCHRKHHAGLIDINRKT